jgi:hypothetical protein
MALEIISSIIGMFTADSMIQIAQAEEAPLKPRMVQMGPPRPTYRVPREQRFEVIRKRFDQQLEADKNTPDPHADMWDKDWINKKD